MWVSPLFCLLYCLVTNRNRLNICAPQSENACPSVFLPLYFWIGWNFLLEHLFLKCFQGTHYTKVCIMEVEKQIRHFALIYWFIYSSVHSFTLCDYVQKFCLFLLVRRAGIFSGVRVLTVWENRLRLKKNEVNKEFITISQWPSIEHYLVGKLAADILFLVW